MVSVCCLRMYERETHGQMSLLYVNLCIIMYKIRKENFIKKIVLPSSSFPMS